MIFLCVVFVKGKGAGNQLNELILETVQRSALV